MWNRGVVHRHSRLGRLCCGVRHQVITVRHKPQGSCGVILGALAFTAAMVRYLSIYIH